MSSCRACSLGGALGGGGLPLSDPSFTCAKLDPNGREIYISVTIVEKNLAGLLSRMVRS